jgi:hypothetical protein
MVAIWCPGAGCINRAIPSARFELSRVTRHLFSKQPKKFVRRDVLSRASPACEPFLPTIDAKCGGYAFRFPNANFEDRVQGSRRSVPAPNAPGWWRRDLPVTNNSWPDEEPQRPAPSPAATRQRQSLWPPRPELRAICGYPGNGASLRVLTSPDSTDRSCHIVHACNWHV